MARAERGFSAVELLFVLVIVVILTGMVISPALSRAQSRLGAQNARDAYITLSLRARAAAMNTGQVVRFEVAPGTDHAWVATASGDTIASIRYAGGGDVRADVATSTGDTVRVCYTSKGFALPGCTSSSLPATVTFRLGPSEAWAQVRPLGQVVPQ